MAEEDSGFSVIDKRHVHDEGAEETAKAESAPQTSEETPQPEPERQSHHQALPKLAVRDRLLMCIDILYQSACISMGMVSHPSTAQPAPNIQHTNAAIHTSPLLAGNLAPKL